MDDLISIIARVGVVGAGLVGGTFFAFSVFIMAALKRMPDAGGIHAMQLINRTVFSPWFMGPFFGTALLSVGAVALGLISNEHEHSLAMVVGGMLYTFGVFLVTAVGNVPLNEKLGQVEAEEASATEFWHRYLVVWTRWNHVRTVASIGAILAFGIAA